MTKPSEQESRGKFKSAPRLKIRRGSLQVVEATNGFYLYGHRTDESVADPPSVFLGSLGDGVDSNISKPDYNPNDEATTLSEAYGFRITG